MTAPAQLTSLEGGEINFLFQTCKADVEGAMTGSDLPWIGAPVGKGPGLAVMQDAHARMDGTCRTRLPGPILVRLFLSVSLFIHWYALRTSGMQAFYDADNDRNGETLVKSRG